MRMYNQKQVEQLRKRYPKGTRLCLDFMDEAGMPPGLQGTVAFIDDAGQIHMHWENGRSLAIVPGVDSFHRVDGPANEVPKDGEKPAEVACKRSDLWVWLLFLPVVWWAGAITACAIEPDTNLLQILQVLTEKLDQPFSITYTPYTLRCVFTFTIAYVLGIGIYYSQKRNYRRGVEHGSAKWGDAASICKRYRDKRYTQNLILTQNFRMGLDCYKHKRNLNVLVVGGSGAGKSRVYAVVNIMQCNCSMVITDPKGELLRKTGGLLEREGYEVRVFDLINPETSFCYNPFAYVRDDKDVLKLINNLIRNTTPKGAQSSDPFWEKSETALLQALMLYLLHEAPPEEQNFSMIMEMLGSAQVKEDDEEYQSPLDILFERLEMRNPESIAVKQYAIYKQAAGVIELRRTLNHCFSEICTS